MNEWHEIGDRWADKRTQSHELAIKGCKRSGWQAKIYGIQEDGRIAYPCVIELWFDSFAEAKDKLEKIARVLEEPWGKK